MTEPSAGLHHITAICGDPAANVQFYTRVLGLRLVKKTVNFDDPGTYHLYYGDETGSPGSALTFFAFADAPTGIPGTGAPVEIGFAVPKSSISFWADRLHAHDIVFEQIERFDEPTLVFADHDAIALAIRGVAWADELAGRAEGPVPAVHAVRGFAGVGVWVDAEAPTAGVLEDVFGYRRLAANEDRVRYQAASGPSLGAAIDLRIAPELAAERQGVGSIHHIAFRASDDAHQMTLRERLVERDVSATRRIDRQYFHSVYFREPGGSLFEIATDGPGFTVDEPRSALGSSLKLPPQYESQRAALEARLPPL